MISRDRSGGSGSGNGWRAGWLAGLGHQGVADGSSEFEVQDTRESVGITWREPYPLLAPWLSTMFHDSCVSESDNTQGRLRYAAGFIICVDLV